MPFHPVLLLHICGAVVGLLSGYLAMVLRKGSSWHGAAGSVFFVSMVVMSTSGAYFAAFVKPHTLNVIVGLLTCYLVATAWWAARRREARTGAFDYVALLYVVAVGVGAVAAGIDAAIDPKGARSGMLAALYFIFGSVALLCAGNDVRMVVRGSLSGAHRIARHLWRMSLALLIATLSFYPGQAKLLPALRSSGLMFLPHLLLVGSMIYWLYRVKSRKRTPGKPLGRKLPDVIPGTAPAA